MNASVMRGTLAVVLVALGGAVWWQAGRISALDDQLKATQDSVGKLGQAPGTEQPTAPAAATSAAQRVNSAASLRETKLTQRVAALEAALAKRGVAVAAVSLTESAEDEEDVAGDDVAALREDVDALLLDELPTSDSKKDEIRKIAEETARVARETRQTQRRQARAREDEAFITSLQESADLSDDQAKELSGIMGARAELRDTLRQQRRDGTLTRGAMRTQMREARTEDDEAVRELLDEVQYTAYTEAAQERGGWGGGRGGRGRGGVEGAQPATPALAPE